MEKTWIIIKSYLDYQMKDEAFSTLRDNLTNNGSLFLFLCANETLTFWGSGVVHGSKKIQSYKKEPL